MRKYKKALAFISAVCLCSTLVSLPKIAVSANTETLPDFPCEYSASTKDGVYEYFGAGEMITYTAEEAAAAGIPTGYTDNVVSLDAPNGTYDRGILLNFLGQEFTTERMTSVTFRVYIECANDAVDDYPEVRITKPNQMQAWVMRYNAESLLNQWIDIELGVDGTNVASGSSFSDICVDGYLGKFELGLRAKSASNFYIDSVTVNYIQNDGVPPVITYNGADTVVIGEGAVLDLGATAYDEQDQQAIDVEYVWNVEFEGNTPSAGTYTVTMKAADYYGNVAEKTVTVIVEEKDTEAPVIELPTDKIYAMTGTIPVLNVTATDNLEGVTLVKVWSEGALDGYGRLTEGEHTLTYTATDASGNATIATITFYVTADGEIPDNLVDEEELTPDDYVDPSPEDSSSEESSSEESSSKQDNSSSEENSSSKSESSEDEEEDEESSSKKNSSSKKESSSKKKSSKDDDEDEDEEIVDEEELTNSNQNQQQTMLLGCGASIAGAAVALPILLCGVAMAIKKKKDE